MGIKLIVAMTQWWLSTKLLRDERCCHEIISCYKCPRKIKMLPWLLLYQNYQNSELVRWGIKSLQIDCRGCLAYIVDRSEILGIICKLDIMKAYYNVDRFFFIFFLFLLCSAVWFLGKRINWTVLIQRSSWECCNILWF